MHVLCIHIMSHLNKIKTYQTKTPTEILLRMRNIRVFALKYKFPFEIYLHNCTGIFMGTLYFSAKMVKYKNRQFWPTLSKMTGLILDLKFPKIPLGCLYWFTCAMLFVSLSVSLETLTLFSVTGTIYLLGTRSK